MERVVALAAQNDDEKALKQFIAAVNRDIKELNKTIDLYNKETLAKQKIRLIGQIAIQQKLITDKYPASLISSCQQFQQQFQQHLFLSIRQEILTLGLKRHPLSQHTPKFFHDSDSKRLFEARTNFIALNSADNKVFEQGFKYFFGSTRANKEDNYKLAIKSFLVELIKESEPVLVYKKLWQLRALLQIAIPEHNVTAERAAKLNTLIELIDDKLCLLQTMHPELKEDSWAAKSNCAELIVSMAPEKIDEFILALERGPGFELSELEALYQPDDAEYSMWQSFIATHSLVFLGGRNSKNFKLTNLENNSHFVLKIDNRLDAPKNLETRLMARVLSETITPIFAQRQTTYKTHKETKTRVLVLTEFCEGGNLEEHALSQADDNSRSRAAVHIYRQMAENLETIRLNKVAFLDMKNTNWLVDLFGRLKIADTKSFLPLIKGIFDRSAAVSQWFSPVSTTYMNPPELFTFKGTFNADAIHAYELGKNIYQYLLKGHRSFSDDLFYLHKRHDSVAYNFDYPVFKTDTGMRLQALISALIKPEAKDRLSVADALVSLTELDNMLGPFVVTTPALGPVVGTLPSVVELPQIDGTAVQVLEQECNTLLNEIQLFQLNSRDSLMSRYLANAQDELTKIAQQSMANQLIAVTELRNRLVSARDSVASFEPRKIKEVIRSLRLEGATGWFAVVLGLFSINKSNKAERVEAAFLSIPIEQRGQAFSSNNTLREALAMHRHFGWRNEVYRNKDNSVDEQAAAHSFKAVLSAVREHTERSYSSTARYCVR